MNFSRKNHSLPCFYRKHIKNNRTFSSKPQVIMLLLLFLFTGISTEAQILKKLKNRSKEAAKEAVIRKTEEKVTKETEKAMDTILDGTKGNKNKKTSTQDNEIIDNQSKAPDEDMMDEEPITSQDQRPWSKYNFVPGDKIIFHDDLISEENGEFPSRWDLLKGNAENAMLVDENIINFENRSIITPLMETQNYLPEVFTIEFDAYFEDVHASWQSYNIRFWQGDSYLQVQKGEVYWPINIQSNGAFTMVRAGGDKKYNGFDDAAKGQLPGWKHIAISFNKRTLKVFVDEYRALNIPNLKLNPQMLSIESYIGSREGLTMAIKNIRVAEGGKKLYDRVMAEGKFVTRGILFDVNKATLKRESMGVLNEVATMMQEHTDLNFSIEGHTDSDGADDYNLELSAQRAAAVKEALINIGISEERLQTEGKGEAVPVADNKTPEGKANNRRVEFVKI